MLKKLLPLLLFIPFANAANAQLGIYDIELIWGVNSTKPKKNLNAESEVGTDYDIGLTFLNIPYSDESPATTVTLHYCYTRQNFSSYQLINEIKFRRNEVYARIKPMTFNPSYDSDYSRIFGLVLAGLYVDIGYTNGKYFIEDYLDNPLPNDDKKSGMFWGWGYSCNFKKGRWGGVFGYGSKIYNFKSIDNVTTIKYSARSFQFGLSYSLIWKGDKA